MRKFAFRLQVVLDHRREEEEKQLRILAAVQNEKWRKEQEISQQDEIRLLHLQIMSDFQKDPFDPREMVDMHNRLDAINDDFFGLQCELTEIENKLQKQQQKVLESMRARKVLDQLRDKQMTLYQHEVAREELQIMEEAVNPRISREAMERARNQTEI
ncbi:MAG: hypothetical protein WCO98_03530 [bacterium]